jgi:hypothetical protein
VQPTAGKGQGRKAWKGDQAEELAAAGVDRPLACTSGNPSAAGSLLLGRTVVRYHGDFDWPGIAIARRIIGQGAQPWRLGCADYREAVERLPAGRSDRLTGGWQRCRHAQQGGIGR